MEKFFNIYIYIFFLQNSKTKNKSIKWFHKQKIPITGLKGLTFVHFFCFFMKKVFGIAMDFFNALTWNHPQTTGPSLF